MEKLKKTKVFWDAPDYNYRDSNSMDMKKLHKMPNPSHPLLFAVIFLWGACHLFSNDSVRHAYLSFHSPPRLSFHEVPAVADRSNLLRLPALAVDSAELTVIEDNSSAEISEFPLTSYEEDDLDLKIIDDAEKSEILPPSDPFDDFTMGGAEVDSTDQLIQLFEDLERTGNTPLSASVNFIPPYATDTANFKVQSTSKYTRRARP